MAILNPEVRTTTTTTTTTLGYYSCKFLELEPFSHMFESVLLAAYVSDHLDNMWLICLILHTHAKKDPVKAPLWDCCFAAILFLLSIICHINSIVGHEMSQLKKNNPMQNELVIKQVSERTSKPTAVSKGIRRKTCRWASKCKQTFLFTLMFSFFEVIWTSPGPPLALPGPPVQCWDSLELIKFVCVSVCLFLSLFPFVHISVHGLLKCFCDSGNFPPGRP